MTDVQQFRVAARDFVLRPPDSIAIGGVKYRMEFVRGDLRYILNRHEDEAFYIQKPVGPITVDGIVYQETHAYCESPMFTLKNDHDYDGDPQHHSAPPLTDAELDAWVHEGGWGL